MQFGLQSILRHDMRVYELGSRKQKNFNHSIHVIQCKAQNSCSVTAQQPKTNYVNENQQQQSPPHQKQQHQCPPPTAENVMMNKKEYLSKDCDFKCKFAKKRRFRIYSMFERRRREKR